MKFNTFIQSLSRVTSAQKFVPEIDGLRFFAIITVLIFHLNTAFSDAIGSGGAMAQGVDDPWQLGWWIIRLDLGVKVFFAISGFILAIPFVNQYWFNGREIILKDYLLRRLTRLEPPYIIALTLFFGVHIFIFRIPFQEYFDNFLASLVYIHNFVYGRSSVILPVAWSLEVEVQFYLLVPLLALMVFKPKMRVVGVLAMLALFVATIFSKHYIMSHHLVTIGSSILVYFSHFAIGILFSMLYLAKPEFIKKKHVAWDVLGLTAIFVMFYFYKPQASMLNNLVFNPAIFVLFLAAFKGVYLNKLFSQPIIYIIGGMCYSIYLIHFPLLLLMVKASKFLGVFESYYANLGIQFLVLIPLVVAISAVFFKFFEQPFMDKHWVSKFVAVAKSKLNVKSLKK